MKTCPNCSAKIGNNSKACKYCGESLVPKTEKELEEEKIAQRNERFKKWVNENENKLVKISNWICILFLIGSFYFGVTIGFGVNGEWGEQQSFALKFFLWPIPIIIIIEILLGLIGKVYPLEYKCEKLAGIGLEVLIPFIGSWYIGGLISFVLGFFVFKDTSGFWNFVRGIMVIGLMIAVPIIIIKIIKVIFKTSTTQSFWIFIGCFFLIGIISISIQAHRDEVDFKKRKQQLINEVKDAQRENEDAKDEIRHYYGCDVDFSEFDTDFKVSSENTMRELEDMREKLEEEGDYIARIYDHVERYGCRGLY